MLVKIIFNGSEYYAVYNENTDSYELTLTAPNLGGVYQVEAEAIDAAGEVDTKVLDLQVLTRQAVVLENDETVVYFLDQDNLDIKDVVEFENYEYNIDEETNAKTTFNIYRKNNVRNGDIVILKRKDEIDYIGIVEDATSEDGKNSQLTTLKYITNIFDRKILLTNEEIMHETGVEDFIVQTIEDYFTQSDDTLLNISWLQVEALSHTPIVKAIDNDNGIYNFHTFITNCSQNYNIVYKWTLLPNYTLKLQIYQEAQSLRLVDTTTTDISSYTEVYETDVVAKVTVKTATDVYNWYLKDDRTITDNASDPNRAKGKIEVVYTENDDDAYQTALDAFKANSYKHYIGFRVRRSSKLFDVANFHIGTPLSVRTDNNVILDTYISAIKDNGGEFIDITCGNMRINFIDKLKQERNKEQ